MLWDFRRFPIAASQIRRSGLQQMPSLLPKLGSNLPARLGRLFQNAVDFCGTLAQLRAASEMLFNR